MEDGSGINSEFKINEWGSPDLVDNVGRMREKETVMEANVKVPKVRHDETFKRAAVELLVSSGKPPKQIARELGVSVWNLRDWKKRYRPAGSGVARTLEQAEAENRALREELQRVKNQRDILKKTLGIISAPPETGLPA
jgi:transposase